MGDPAGIGPEVLLKALRSGRVRRVATPVIVGDRRVLEVIAAKTGISIPRYVQIINPSDKPPALGTLRPGFLPLPWAREVPSYIEEAVRLVTSGDSEAIVTAPINKGALRKAGFSFPGHTEFLAHLTGTKDYVMMLGGKDLKVALVTIHEPLKRVPSLITKEKILKTIKVTDLAFRRFFAVDRPRIGVLGLNPHAGEGGLFGDEERSIIAPAIKSARRSGIEAIGPVVPDTAFIRSVKGEFDVLVCMYHDQGLGPLKLLHFDDGINATLGLPVIRTSVDHGTAYDLAWQGAASHASMVSAIETAALMALSARDHG